MDKKEFKIYYMNMYICFLYVAVIMYERTMAFKHMVSLHESLMENQNFLPASDLINRQVLRNFLSSLEII